MTWLRNHKATEQEVALKEAGDAHKDEPSWVVEQLLSRKRGELLRQWEDREKRLASFRLKERAQEERSRKRRRVEDTRATIETTVDEDAEWLLDTDDHDVRQEDALSGLSKESREILEKIGLGNRIKQADKDEEIIEEKIKVRVLTLIQSLLIVTGDDRYIIHPEPIPNYHNLLQNYVDLYFHPPYPLQFPKDQIFPQPSQ